MLHPAVNLLHNSLLDAPLRPGTLTSRPIAGCSTERGTKIRAQPVNHPLNVPAAHTHRQGHLTQPLIRKLHQRMHRTQTHRQITAHQSCVRRIPPSFTAPAQSHLYPSSSASSATTHHTVRRPYTPKPPPSVTETNRQPPAAPQLPNATPPQTPGRGAPPTASSHPTPPQQLPRAAHTHPSFAP